MQTLFALAARSASVDTQTGLLSVFEVLESIHATKLPALAQDFIFVTLLERSAGDPDRHEGTIVLTLGDRLLHSQKLPIDFGGRKRARVLVRLGGLEIPAAGVLSVRIEGQDRAADIDIEPPEGSA